MLTVAEAIERLLTIVAPLDVSDRALVDGLGMTLAQDVDSPTDLPPFDKSSMDGYAVRASDVTTGTESLRVVEVITAGRTPTQSIGPGEAAQIMTGAPLPIGADCVIKVEDTHRIGDFVKLSTQPAVAGSFVIVRGNSVRSGMRALTSGLVLNGSRIGALAELGCGSVRVRRRPRVAVLATGDELVAVDETPGPGQIRNSNEVMLAAQIETAGGVPVRLGIARDNVTALRQKIEEGLACDVLVLSGGVSAGTLDLVPSVLADANVNEVFHKVHMKPGKPVWFGVQATKPICYVFGLPGNPVSSLVCCELFVRTAIKRLMGIEPAEPQSMLATLEHDHSTGTDRPTYHPARWKWTSEGLVVSLVSWHGSSDLCGTVAANGMAYLSGEARQYRVGDRLETFAW